MFYNEINSSKLGYQRIIGIRVLKWIVLGGPFSMTWQLWQLPKLRDASGWRHGGKGKTSGSPCYQQRDCFFAPPFYTLHIIVSFSLSYPSHLKFPIHSGWNTRRFFALEAMVTPDLQTITNAKNTVVPLMEASSRRRASEKFGERIHCCN